METRIVERYKGYVIRMTEDGLFIALVKSGVRLTRRCLRDMRVAIDLWPHVPQTA